MDKVLEDLTLSGDVKETRVLVEGDTKFGLSAPVLSGGSTDRNDSGLYRLFRKMETTAEPFSVAVDKKPGFWL
jgi:hypothetical protein